MQCGEVIDYGVHHPAQVLGAAAIVGACAAGGPADPPCDALVLGAAAGAIGYSIGSAGKSDWSWDDFGSNAVAGELITGTVYLGLGPWAAEMGGDMTLFNSQAAAKAVFVYGCTASIVAFENIVASAVIGHPTPLSVACSTATSFIPGVGGVIGSAVCGAAGR
jgi:hypothetical protein